MDLSFEGFRESFGEASFQPGDMASVMYYRTVEARAAAMS